MVSSGIGAGQDAVVTFRLGGDLLGLPVSMVREVLPIAWLDRPPTTPSMVHGILNLGGRAVPVLRLDRLLGLADGRYGLDASILIMRGDLAGNPGPGLLVEHVEGVLAAGAATSQGLDPAKSFNGCVADQVLVGGRCVPLLDWRKVLLAEERLRLAEFQAVAQSRLTELGAALS